MHLTAAAKMAEDAKFDNIAKNCAALAKALASLDIKMESKFGSYGPNNKINETSLTKVKTFMGNSPNNPPSANNAPTRGAILSQDSSGN